MHTPRVEYIKTKDAIKRIEHIVQLIKSHVPVLLEGSTGTAKSFSASIALESISGEKPIFFSFSSQTSTGELIGKMSNFKDENGNGEFKFVPGKFMEAFTEGKCLILDEINLAHESDLQCIEASLDSGLLSVDIPGFGPNSFPKKDGFYIVATQNPVSERFAKKRQMLSDKFMSHFQLLTFPDIEKSEMIEIARGFLLNEKAPGDLDYIAKTIVEFHFRWKERSFSKNETHVFTIRDMANAIHSLVGENALSLYDAILLYYGGRYSKVDKSYEELCEMIDKIDHKLKSENTLKKQIIPDDSNFLNNKVLQRIVDESVFLLQSQHPVLLVGPEGCGKTAIARLIGKIFCGLDAKLFVCTPEMSTKDIIGRDMPSQDFQSLIDAVHWEDGPVLSAAKDGSSIILDQINAAPSAIAERLNSLFDIDNSRIFDVHENPSESSIVVHEQFRIIATSTPEGIEQLSPALLNRFSIVYVDDQIKNMTREEKMSLALKIVPSISKESVELIQKESFQTIAGFCELVRGVGALEANLKNIKDKKIIIDFMLEIINSSQSEIIKSSKLVPILVDELLSKLDKNAQSTYHFMESSNTKKLMAILTACYIIGKHIILVGPTGLGKTHGATAFSTMIDSSRKPLPVTPFNGETRLDELFGFITIDQGKISMKNGPLLNAINDGRVFIADELNLAQPQIIQSLSVVMEPRVGESILLPGYSSVPTTIKEGFMFIGCQNDINMRGRNKLPDIIVHKSLIVKVPEPERNDLFEVIKAIQIEMNCKVTRYNCEHITDLMLEMRKHEFFKKKAWSFREIRKLFKRLAIKEISGATISDFAAFMLNNYFNSVRDCNVMISDLIAKSFKFDNATKERLLETLNSDVSIDINPRNKHVVMSKGYINITLKNTNIHNVDPRLQTFWKALFNVKMTPKNEPLLFVGETGLKSYLAGFSALNKKEVYLSSDSTTSSLIGQAALLSDDKAEAELFSFLQDFIRESPDHNQQDKILEIKEIFKSKRFDDLDNIINLIVELNPKFEGVIRQVGKKIMSIRTYHGSNKYTTIFTPGLITHAIFEGFSLVLKNIAQPSASVLERFNDLLSVPPSFSLVEDLFETFSSSESQVIDQFDDGFRIIGTCRSHEKIGLSDAMLSRLTEINVPCYTPQEQMYIYEKTMPQYYLFKKYSQIMDKEGGQIKYSQAMEISRASNKWTIKDKTLLGFIRFALGPISPYRRKDILAKMIEGSDGSFTTNLLSLFERKKIDENGAYGYEQLFTIDHANIQSKITGISLVSNYSFESTPKIVFTPSISDTIDVIFTALSSETPLILDGPSGSGKSLAVDYLSALLNANVVKVSLSKATTIEDLFGRDELDLSTGGRQTTFKETKLLKALTNPNPLEISWVVFEELNQASASVFDALRPIFKKDSDNITLGNGNTCQKGCFFVIGLTSKPLSNTSIATTALYHTVFNYTNAEQEYIMKKMFIEAGLEDDFNSFIGAFNIYANNSGKIATVRQAENYIRMRTVMQELSIDELLMLQMGGRIADEDKRMAAMNLILNGNEEENIEFPTIRVTFDGRLLANKAKIPIVNNNPEFLDFGCLTLRQRLLYEYMICATQAQIPVLVQGPTASGKSYSIITFAKACNQKLQIVQLNQDTDSSTIIGNYKMEKPLNRDEEEELDSLLSSNGIDERDDSTLMATAINWKNDEDKHKKRASKLIFRKNGNLTREKSKIVNAMKNGYWLLLDGIESAPLDFCDKIIPLLDPKSPVLDLFELGSECKFTPNSENPKYRIHKNFRIFITMNTDNGKANQISNSLIDRCALFTLPSLDLYDIDSSIIAYNQGTRHVKFESELDSFTIAVLLSQMHRKAYDVSNHITARNLIHFCKSIQAQNCEINLNMLHEFVATHYKNDEQLFSIIDTTHITEETEAAATNLSSYIPSDNQKYQELQKMLNDNIDNFNLSKFFFNITSITLEEIVNLQPDIDEMIKKNRFNAKAAVIKIIMKQIENVLEDPNSINYENMSIDVLTFRMVMQSKIQNCLNAINTFKAAEGAPVFYTEFEKFNHFANVFTDEKCTLKDLIQAYISFCQSDGITCPIPIIDNQLFRSMSALMNKGYTFIVSMSKTTMPNTITLGFVENQPMMISIRDSVREVYYNKCCFSMTGLSKLLSGYLNNGYFYPYPEELELDLPVVFNDDFQADLITRMKIHSFSDYGEVFFTGIERYFFNAIKFGKPQDSVIAWTTNFIKEFGVNIDMGTFCSEISDIRTLKEYRRTISKIDSFNNIPDELLDYVHQLVEVLNSNILEKTQAPSMWINLITTIQKAASSNMYANELLKVINEFEIDGSDKVILNANLIMFYLDKEKDEEMFVFQWPFIHQPNAEINEHARQFNALLDYQILSNYIQKIEQLDPLHGWKYVCKAFNSDWLSLYTKPMWYQIVAEGNISSEDIQYIKQILNSTLLCKLSDLSGRKSLTSLFNTFSNPCSDIVDGWYSWVNSASFKYSLDLQVPTYHDFCLNDLIGLFIDMQNLKPGILFADIQPDEFLIEYLSESAEIFDEYDSIYDCDPIRFIDLFVEKIKQIHSAIAADAIKYETQIKNSPLTSAVQKKIAEKLSIFEQIVKSLKEKSDEPLYLDDAKYLTKCNKITLLDKFPSLGFFLCQYPNIETTVFPHISYENGYIPLGIIFLRIVSHQFPIMMQMPPELSMYSKLISSIGRRMPKFSRVASFFYENPPEFLPREAHLLRTVIIKLLESKQIEQIGGVLPSVIEKMLLMLTSAEYEKIQTSPVGKHEFLKFLLNPWIEISAHIKEEKEKKLVPLQTQRDFLKHMPNDLNKHLKSFVTEIKSPISRDIQRIRNKLLEIFNKENQSDELYDKLIRYWRTYSATINELLNKPELSFNEKRGNINITNQVLEKHDQQKSILNIPVFQASSQRNYILYIEQTNAKFDVYCGMRISFDGLKCNSVFKIPNSWNVDNLKCTAPKYEILEFLLSKPLGFFRPTKDKIGRRIDNEFNALMQVFNEYKESAKQRSGERVGFDNISVQFQDENDTLQYKDVYQKLKNSSAEISILLDNPEVSYDQIISKIDNIISMLQPTFSVHTPERPLETEQYLEDIINLFKKYSEIAHKCQDDNDQYRQIIEDQNKLKEINCFSTYQTLPNINNLDDKVGFKVLNRTNVDKSQFLSPIFAISPITNEIEANFEKLNIKFGTFIHNVETVPSTVTILNLTGKQITCEIDPDDGLLPIPDSTSDKDTCLISIPSGVLPVGTHTLSGRAIFNNSIIIPYRFVVKVVPLQVRVISNKGLTVNNGRALIKTPFSTDHKLKISFVANKYTVNDGNMASPIQPCIRIQSGLKNTAKKPKLSSTKTDCNLEFQGLNESDNSNTLNADVVAYYSKDISIPIVIDSTLTRPYINIHFFSYNPKTKNGKWIQSAGSDYPPRVYIGHDYPMKLSFFVDTNSTRSINTIVKSNNAGIRISKTNQNEFSFIVNVDKKVATGRYEIEFIAKILDKQSISTVGQKIVINKVEQKMVIDLIVKSSFDDDLKTMIYDEKIDDWRQCDVRKERINHPAILINQQSIWYHNPIVNLEYNEERVLTNYEDLEYEFLVVDRNGNPLIIEGDMTTLANGLELVNPNNKLDRKIVLLGRMKGIPSTAFPVCYSTQISFPQYKRDAKNDYQGYNQIVYFFTHRMYELSNTVLRNITQKIEEFSTPKPTISSLGVISLLSSINTQFMRRIKKSGEFPQGPFKTKINPSFPEMDEEKKIKGINRLNELLLANPDFDAIKRKHTDNSATSTSVLWKDGKFYIESEDTQFPNYYSDSSSNLSMECKDIHFNIGSSNTVTALSDQMTLNEIETALNALLIQVRQFPFTLIKTINEDEGVRNKENLKIFRTFYCVFKWTKDSEPLSSFPNFKKQFQEAFHALTTQMKKANLYFNGINEVAENVESNSNFTDAFQYRIPEIPEQDWRITKPPENTKKQNRKDKPRGVMVRRFSNDLIDFTSKSGSISIGPVQSGSVKTSKTVNTQQLENEKTLISALINEMTNPDSTQSLSFTLNEDFHYCPDAINKMIETVPTVGPSVSRQAHAYAFQVISEIEGNFDSTYASILVDTSYTLSFKEKANVVIFVQALSTILSIHNIPYAIIVFCDQGFQLIIKPVEASPSDKDCDRLIAALTPRRRVSRISDAILMAREKIKYPGKKHHSIFVISDGLNRNFHLVDDWKSTVLTRKENEPEVSIGMIFYDCHNHPKIHSRWDSFINDVNRNSAPNAIKVHLKYENEILASFSNFKILFNEVLNSKENSEYSLKETLREETISADLSIKISEIETIFSSIKDSTMNSSSFYTKDEEEVIDDVQFEPVPMVPPPSPFIIQIDNIDDFTLLQRTKFINRVLFTIEKLMLGLNDFASSVYPPNLPMQYMPSTSGSIFYFPGLIRFILTHGQDTKIFLEKKAGLVRSHAVVVIVDCSSSSMAFEGRQHAILSTFILLNALSKIDIPNITVMATTAKGPRLLCFNQPSQIALVGTSHIWPVLLDLMLRPHNCNCLDSAVSAVTDIRLMLQEKAMVCFVLSSGQVSNRSAKVIKTACHQLEQMKTISIQIGIGSYVKMIFDHGIRTISPRDTLKAIYSLDLYTDHPGLMSNPNVLEYEIYADYCHELKTFFKADLIAFYDLYDIVNTIERSEESFFIWINPNEIGGTGTRMDEHGSQQMSLNTAQKKDADFSLIADGKLRGLQILICMFWDCSMHEKESRDFCTEKLNSGILKAIKAKGVQPTIKYNYMDCINAIKNGPSGSKIEYKQIWVICGRGDGRFPEFSNDRANDSFWLRDTFIDICIEYWKKGGSIVWWADNHPFDYEANLFFSNPIVKKYLECDFQLAGNYEGMQTIYANDKMFEGAFNRSKIIQCEGYKRHSIARNIPKMNEGYTLSYPVTEGQDFPRLGKMKIFSINSEGGILSFFYPSPLPSKSNPAPYGDLYVDCGVSKLFSDYEAENCSLYTINIACFMMNIELSDITSRPDITTEDFKNFHVPASMPLRYAPKPENYNSYFDIVFILDITGSMSRFADVLRSSIPDVVDSLQARLQENSKIRVGCIPYADPAFTTARTKYDPDYYHIDKNPIPLRPTTVQEFNKYIKRIFDAQAIAAGGGGDGPEDWLSAYNTLKDYPFGSGTKIVIHICDAPAHGKLFQNYEPMLHYAEVDDEADRKMPPLLQQLAKTDIQFFGICNRNARPSFSAIQSIFARSGKTIHFNVMPFDSMDDSLLLQQVHREIQSSADLSVAMLEQSYDTIEKSDFGKHKERLSSQSIQSQRLAQNHSARNEHGTSGRRVRGMQRNTTRPLCPIMNEARIDELVFYPHPLSSGKDIWPPNYDGLAE